MSGLPASPDPLKTCAKCRQQKPLSAFSRYGASGRQSRCKSCNAVDAKERYYADVEKSRAYSREDSRRRHAENPERRRALYLALKARDPEKYRAGQQKWPAKNPDKVRATNAAWYQRNKERVRANYASWAKANPERLKALRNTACHRRRVRKKLNGLVAGFHTEAEWASLVERACGKCAMCKKRRKLTRDHIIPLSKGGGDEITNIQPLCISCNSRKRDKLLHLPLVWPAVPKNVVKSS